MDEVQLLQVKHVLEIAARNAKKEATDATYHPLAKNYRLWWQQCDRALKLVKDELEGRSG